MLRNDHVALPVSNMDEAITFYSEKLGLQVTSRQIDPVQQEEFGFLALQGGNLELLKSLSHPFERPEIRPPYCPHLALATDDMNTTLEMIEQQGIPLIAGPFKIEGKVTWLYVVDPDNNVIEFVQWLE